MLSGGAVKVHRAHLSLGRLRLRVGCALLTPPGDLQAHDVAATLCPCDRPTWRIEARQARVRRNGDVVLSSPTLRIGELAVAWLPMFWVRTGRQIGLRPPLLAFRGREGVWGGLDAFVPVGPIDADVGFAAASRAPVEGRLRASASGQRADVIWRPDGAITAGAISLGPAAGVATAALRWDLASTRAIRPQRAQSLEQALDRPRPLELFTHADGGPVQFSSGVALSQYTGRDGELRFAGALPQAELATEPLILGGRAQFDARLSADRLEPQGTERASFGTRLLWAVPVSALDLRGGAMVEATGWKEPAQRQGAFRLAASAQSSVSLELGRRLGEWFHEVETSLTVAATALSVKDGPRALPVDDLDAIERGLVGEVAIATRLETSAAELAVDVEVGALVENADEPLAFARLSIPVGVAMIEGSLSRDVSASWSLEGRAAVEVGPLRVGILGAWLDPGRSLLSERRPRVGELGSARLPILGGRVAGAQIALAPGRLRLQARGAWDFDADALAAADGSIAYVDPCGCLSVGLAASVWSGRSLPDVSLVVSLDR